MEPLQTRLGLITEKLQSLLKKHYSLQKENEKLRAELEIKNELIGVLQQKTESNQEQIGLLKAAAGQLDEVSRKELEKRIDQYVKEIDRCIALLEDS